MTVTRMRTNMRMSQIVSVDPGARWIILAGQVAVDRTQDIGGQTRQILATIDDLLAEAGAERGDIVSASIWLANVADFEAMNAVWDRWVPEGKAPARATVESKLADPRIKVEIQVVAAVAA